MADSQYDASPVFRLLLSPSVTTHKQVETQESDRSTGFNACTYIDSCTYIGVVSFITSAALEWDYVYSQSRYFFVQKVDH